MNFFDQLKIFTLTLTMFIGTYGYARVKRINYTTAFEQLKPFVNQDDPEPLKGSPIKLPEMTDTLTKKLKYHGYEYAVFYQVKNAKIDNFFARLPPFFSHDEMHRLLISKWGKQKSYKKRDEFAIYEWKVKNQTIFYAATCSITCFPVYLAGMAKIEDSIFQAMQSDLP